MQLFIDADFEQHYFTLYEDEANHDQLRAMCAFDLVGNNTDRKSGHCLLGLDGRIRGIDHGLMFHHEFKLRTVIWEFGGEPVPEPILAAVDALAADELPDPLAAPARPVRARRRARPRPGARARRLLPDRRDRPPLPLAARLARRVSCRRRRRRRAARSRGKRTTSAPRSMRRTFCRSSHDDELLGRHRAAEQVALGLVAAVAAEQRLGVGALHALGDGAQPEAAAELDERPHDDGVLVVHRHRHHERLVDLQLA